MGFHIKAGKPLLFERIMQNRIDLSVWDPIIIIFIIENKKINKFWKNENILLKLK